MSLSSVDTDAMSAAKNAIAYLKEKVNWQAGVIVIDNKGHLGVDCATPAVLAVGYEHDAHSQCFFNN